MIVPLYDRVVIRRLEAESMTKGGLFIPDAAKEKLPEGIVMFVGNGRLVDGVEVPLQVKIGDKVIFSKFSGNEIRISGETVVIMKEDEILGIIKGD